MRYDLIKSTFGDEEKRALEEVLAGGRFTMHDRVRAFESAFAAYFGARRAVMVNSGSSANLLGVAALFYRRENPLRAGDEVVVPCIAWSTTYNPLQQYGLRLKVVDVDIETLTYDMDRLAEAVGPRTRMVVAVNILGNPCHLGEIADLCRERGIILFEDNCESMGATYRGKHAGTFGLIGTFSTFFSHQISTVEGGLLLTDDEEIYCLAKSLRSHGWTRDQDGDSGIIERRDEDFFEAYRFILPGYNLRPTEFQGALGLAQMKKIDGFLDARRRNARYFVERFGDDRRFILQKETGTSSWFCFTMIVAPRSGLDRARVLAALKKAGIEFRIVTGGNFLRHDVRRFFDYESDGAPNADLVHDNGFFVGNYHLDLRNEIDYLSAVLGRL